MGTPPRKLFAFYNCGDDSGASQPHRHVQFLPVEDMRYGLDDSNSWDLLIERNGGSDAISLGMLVRHISATSTGQNLYDLYIELLREARARTGVDNISYNIGMTRSVLAVFPRRKGDVHFSEGHVGLNGTIVAGTLMVKRKEEWEALRNDAGILDMVLKESAALAGTSERGAGL